MSSHVESPQADPAAVTAPEPDGTAMSRWRQLRLLIKVVELRLRFIVLMAATGLVFAYWDHLADRYDKWMRPASSHQTTRQVLEFFCPMHPSIVQDEPGACPICGMPLARRAKGARAVLPAGVTARVELDPGRIAQAGIATALVAYAPLTQSMRTVGTVGYDERRLAVIASKIPGKSRVEKLFVNFTGQNVSPSQPLAELYSPELAQAVEELVSAARRSALAVAPQTELGRALANDRRELVSASAEKLRRWGITPAQVDRIMKSEQTDFKFTIMSPIGGHVVKKNVVEGQEVSEGYAMFEVADLGTVWVTTQVYEHQLPFVHVGQDVRASVEAFPGEEFTGKLEFIQPHVDPATRTVEVRFAVDNPAQRLLPGMFATVQLETPVAEVPAVRSRLAATARSPARGRVVRVGMSVDEQKDCPVTKAKLGSMGEPIAVPVDGGRVWTCCAACPPQLKANPVRYLGQAQQAPRNQVLSVPESAVIDTGTRQVVYVEAEPGVFEGRAVVLGPRAGDRYAVVDGLAPGDKVAAAGAFLIDAESRLNAGTRPASVPATIEPSRHEH